MNTGLLTDINQSNHRIMSSKFLQLATVLSLVCVLSAQVCSSNQYYANDGSCVNCPTNCSSCSNDQFCTSCKPSYFLVSNAFNVTCQTCSQIYIGCNVCISNVACTQCGAGYFLSYGTCIPCSTKIIFCNSCSSDGNTCTLCNFPFIIQNNLCVSATVSSITGSPITAETTNSNASTNTNTSSANTTQFIILPNGTKAAPVLDINGCNQVQVFYQGRCIKSIPHCNIYQSTGLCAYCQSGYIVTIYGDCSIKNRVLICENGFWLDQTTDTCVKVSASCDYYYPSNGSCVNCSANFKLSNGSCIQAIQCNSRQFFFEGFCIDVPRQCITFNSDGTCTACETGYNLLAGVCAIQQNTIVGGANCKFPCNTCHFTNSTYCFSCVIYYQLSGAQYGTCIPVLN